MKTSPQQRVALLGVILGGLLTSGVVLGPALTAFSMVRAFSVLGSSGIGDPRELSRAIGQTLLYLATGIGAGVLGLPILILSIIALQRMRQAVPPPLAPHLPPPSAP